VNNLWRIKVLGTGFPVDLGYDKI